MVTMHDVAKEAGVSQSTVSHVINGTRAIAPATEAAVREAIERTGYLADDIARSMRGHRTNTVGVATSAISNIYFAEVVSAVERAASSLGRIVMMSDTHEDPHQELEAVRAFVSRRVDGIILAPSADPSESLALLRRRQVPTVLLDRCPADAADFDSVGVLNTQPTSSLVEEVARAGHTRIAFVAGREGLATSTERLAGYRAGMARCGLAEGPIIQGGSERDEAMRATYALLASPDRPTAIISGQNLMTVGVLHAIRQLGLRVPDDLSLAGFDDLPWADLMDPRLTVVAQPLDQLGSQAMRMLGERLATPGLAPRSVRLEPSLLLRDSVGPPTTARI